MYTPAQIKLLRETRHQYYNKNYKYGEAFDANFMDFLSHSEGALFDETFNNAKDDTDKYIFLDAQTPDDYDSLSGPVEYNYN